MLLLLCQRAASEGSRITHTGLQDGEFPVQGQQGRVRLYDEVEGRCADADCKLGGAHIGLQDGELPVQRQQVLVGLLRLLIRTAGVVFQLCDGRPQRCAAHVLPLQLRLQLCNFLRQSHMQISIQWYWWNRMSMSAMTRTSSVTAAPSCTFSAAVSMTQSVPVSGNSLQQRTRHWTLEVRVKKIPECRCQCRAAHVLPL